MSLFNEILSKLQEKISKETEGNEIIAAIISTALGATVTKEQIVVRDTVIQVKGPATLKMAIMLNQKKLLQVLQEKEISVTSIV